MVEAEVFARKRVLHVHFHRLERKQIALLTAEKQDKKSNAFSFFAMLCCLYSHVSDGMHDINPLGYVLRLLAGE